VLRDDFRADSDLDILIEFEPDAHIGLDFITLQEKLSQLFGRSVDLNTPDFLSRHFRQKVINSAQVIYERAECFAFSPLSPLASERGRGEGIVWFRVYNDQ
jgi:hypothetical protein